MRFMQNKKPVIYNTSRFRSSYEAWGKNLMACISFDTKAGEEVIVKTAISSVSTNGAKNNMAELAGLAFDELKAKGEALWEKELGKYTLTADRKTKRTFYTSAYHAALHPFIFQDVDGQHFLHTFIIMSQHGIGNIGIHFLLHQIEPGMQSPVGIPKREYRIVGKSFGFLYIFI